jgi:hypothetical protein
MMEAIATQSNYSGDTKPDRLYIFCMSLFAAKRIKDALAVIRTFNSTMHCRLPTNRPTLTTLSVSAIPNNGSNVPSA